MVTLVRRFDNNGKLQPSPQREQWLAFALPSTQGGEESQTPVKRQWRLFRRPGDKYWPPKPGDRIIRHIVDQVNGKASQWDIPQDNEMKRELFGNVSYLVDSVQVEPIFTDAM